MDPLVERLLRDTDQALARIDRLAPAKRLPRLLLLALEREQIAAVAYSEQMLVDRIARLAIDDETRALVRRAVLWAQHDEALHAQYLRGLLLQSRQPLPTGVVLGHQLVGAVSGWVSAVTHHQALDGSFRVGVARAAVLVGGALGRIPDGLSAELRYQDFRQYCRLSVALEGTAIRSYEHLATVVPASEAATVDRIIADEHRHAAVFTVLADAFDSGDRLRPGLTTADLVARIGAISPSFLPGRARPRASAGGGSEAHGHGDPAFGTGAPVWVEDGTDGQDRRAALRSVLANSGLEELVGRRPGAAVAVSASFMLGYHRRDLSNIVHPELLDELAHQLRRWGAGDVVVLEAPTVYDQFFAHRSVAEVADYFGYRSDHYRVVDVETDLRPINYDRGLGNSSISATWLDADVRITTAKLAGDPTEVAHLSLVSLCGISGRTDRHLYTDRTVDHRTATLMALDVAPPDFAVVDAWAPVADGPLGIMGCARPCPVRRIYAGPDALSVDVAVLDDLGVADPLVATFLRQVDHWRGESKRPSAVIGPSGPIAGYRSPYRGLWNRFVTATSAPVYLHLSGRGKLFVPAMDLDAFPVVGQPGPLVRLARRASQLAFGLHPPRRREPDQS